MLAGAEGAEDMVIFHVDGLLPVNFPIHFQHRKDCTATVPLPLQTRSFIVDTTTRGRRGIGVHHHGPAESEIQREWKVSGPHWTCPANSFRSCITLWPVPDDRECHRGGRCQGTNYLSPSSYSLDSQQRQPALAITMSSCQDQHLVFFMGILFSPSRVRNSESRLHNLSLPTSLVMLPVKEWKLKVCCRDRPWCCRR